MATTIPTPSTPAQQAPRGRSRWMRIARFRHWVQFAFAGLWLGPMGLRLHWLPGCVFHCYGCPLATLACPVGVVAQFSALHVFPLLAAGVVVAAAALVGSLICGWACPFGLLQDLLGKVPTPRWRIPSWMSHGRYVVLAGLVVAVPYVYGEAHRLFICRVCPAGVMEAGLPSLASTALSGQPYLGMSWVKWALLGGFAAAALVAYRPWCAVLCPLGGFLGLFNRLSVFHLRFDRQACTECNLCRSRCRVGVTVERRVNTTRCIRCLECTACGALTPAPGSRNKPTPTGSAWPSGGG